MELTILAVSFTVLLLLGVPVAFAIGLSSVATILAADLPVAIVFQKMVGGMQVFSFLAIPCFVFAGALMLYGGIGSLMATRFADVKTWAVIAPDSENGRDVVRFFNKGVTDASAKAGRQAKFVEPVYASLNKADYKVEIIIVAAA